METKKQVQTTADNPKTHCCFVLSEKQTEFLRSKKYKIDRMECYLSLVALAARETTLVPISKTLQVEILPSQCLVDYTKLAQLWNKDRKTVPKILDAMEEQELLSSRKVGESHIITLNSIAGWFKGGKYTKNDLYKINTSDSPKDIRSYVPRTKVSRIAPSAGNAATPNGIAADHSSIPP